MPVILARLNDDPIDASHGACDDKRDVGGVVARQKSEGDECDPMAAGV